MYMDGGCDSKSNLDQTFHNEFMAAIGTGDSPLVLHFVSMVFTSEGSHLFSKGFVHSI